MIFSDDPDVIAAQNILNILTTAGRHDLTLRHLKVLTGVEYMLRVTKRNIKHPSATEIAQLIGIPAEEFETELRELVEQRFLHEVFATFGPLVLRYKLGSLGGTLMRKMLPKHVPPVVE